MAVTGRGLAGTISPTESSESRVRDRFPILVHTVLRRDDTVLLLRRARTGFLDGWYALPGGHLEQGESVRACAIRECAEEVGVCVEPAALAPLAAFAYRSGDAQGVNFLFSCRRFEGEPRLAEPHLFDDMRWCRVDAFPPQTVGYLARALDLESRGEWFDEFGA
jgi:8-oxo-dGTP pyrophosphatase MutT (NUDIX family)